MRIKTVEPIFRACMSNTALKALLTCCAQCTKYWGAY